MRKVIKSIILITIIGAILISLTACGNKLVATITEEETGVKETREIEFKSGKASRVKWTMEFSDEATAMTTFSMLVPQAPEGSTEQNGNKVTVDVTAKEFEELGGPLGGETKEDIQKYLEEAGHEVK